MTMQKLIDLERIIITGNQAMQQRNALICEMVDSGTSQSDIWRTVNTIRQEMGEPAVTLGAIHVVTRRRKRVTA